jgi:hypothetical protein
MSFTSKITNYDNPYSIGSRLRAKRIKPLLSVIYDVYERKGSVNILDLGGTEKYWGILPKGLLEKNNVSITLLNLPGKNKLEDGARYKYLEGDACDLSSIGDYSFDIVHSNSVIEHVGDWNKMKNFSNGIKRLAKNYFIQTPYYWFPIEPHCMFPFFHWLPKPIKVFLVMRFSLGHWSRKKDVSDAVITVESARLLDIKMFRALFGESEIIVEKFFFLPKSLIAIHSENTIEDS